MTPDYIKKAVSLAKEIHELQLSLMQKIKQKGDVDTTDVRVINSKINYLIGYITALEEKS